jgi:hypothetical protein
VPRSLRCRWSSPLESPKTSASRFGGATYASTVDSRHRPPLSTGQPPFNSVPSPTPRLASGYPHHGHRSKPEHRSSGIRRRQGVPSRPAWAATPRLASNRTSGLSMPKNNDEDRTYVFRGFLENMHVFTLQNVQDARVKFAHLSDESPETPEAGQEGERGWLIKLRGIGVAVPRCHHASSHGAKILSRPGARWQRHASCI